MHWIHRIPTLGLAVEATGEDPEADEPVQIGALMRQGMSGTTPPDMPLRVDPALLDPGLTGRRSWPRPLLQAGREQGQDPHQVLERTTDLLLSAARQGHTVVCSGGHRIIQMLERSCARHGLPAVRHLAREQGVNLRLVDPLLMDQWWDRSRRGPRSLASTCSYHGVRPPQEHMVQQQAAASVELLRAVMELARDADGTLTRLGAGRWEGPRWMELRACQDADDLHRLSQRWYGAQRRALAGDQRRSAA